MLSRVLLSAGRRAEAVKELGELVDLLERGGVLPAIADLEWAEVERAVSASGARVIR